MSTAKATPRFLPTLTEVVEPTHPVDAPVQSEDLMVERVAQRAVAAVQDQLRTTLRALVDEHAQALALRLQEETESAIRIAVSQALTEEKISKA